MMICPWCSKTDLKSVYSTPSIPVFQNKVYATAEDAHKAVTGKVDLLSCNDCGYVFNGAFDSSVMLYDTSYQNEQALSPVFDAYLNDLLQIFEPFRNKSIIEIGCGKGVFLQKLWDHGFNAIGFDTAYEGNDPRVHKAYFQHADVKADLLILRHTLEHISDPFSFLKNLLSLTKADTQIYIEVPALEWIIEHKAFWDIFYEHVNYFTLNSLTAAFDHAESGYLFGGQYMYVLADLHSLRQPANGKAPALAPMQSEIDHYRQFVEQHTGLYVWGAGAKGSTFVNLTDPERKHIKAVIDINPKKAGRYTGLTGHPIISPDQISGQGSILVMNDKYLREIKRTVADKGLEMFDVTAIG